MICGLTNCLSSIPVHLLPLSGPGDSQPGVVISGENIAETITSLPANVTFEIGDDNTALEFEEVYSLFLNSSDPRILPGGNGLFASAQITITDEDRVIVGFQSLRSVFPPDYTFSESQTATVLVGRSNPIAQSFTVDVVGGMSIASMDAL